MSNVAGKTYGMNVITPMTRSMTWINHLIFMTSRAVPFTLHGLIGLSLIHFARWVIIRREQWPACRKSERQTVANDYMLFCSNFNGTWDQYIDAFSDGIPNGLDLFWYASRKYPQSIPATPFKNYIRFNQIDTNYYYNATPGAAQRDIKSALRVYGAVRDLAALHSNVDAQEFAADYRKALTKVQNDLGSQGYAPVASMDTEVADCHRNNVIQQRRSGNA